MNQSQLVNHESPIERRPLHELVAERVRDMIIGGRLAPGAPVNESRLCGELGVSRTPMREAIYTIAAEGLIVLRPGRSTVVRMFPEKEIIDMLNVITELEVMAGRLACANASADEIDDVSAAHSQMMLCYRDRDRMPYFKLNQQIHSMIVAASGNAPLAEMHGLLQSRMKRIRYVGNSSPNNWENAVAEHEEMVEALAFRDEDKLTDVLRRHLENAWPRIQSASHKFNAGR